MHTSLCTRSVGCVVGVVELGPLLGGVRGRTAGADAHVQRTDAATRRRRLQRRSGGVASLQPAQLLRYMDGLN